VIHPQIGLVVLAIVFSSALLGMLVSRILPQDHLTDQTKSVVTMSMGVVGTLTALVLGLLIAGASSSFNTKNKEVTQVAADLIRIIPHQERAAPAQDPAPPNDDHTVSYEDKHISDRSRNLSGSVYRWTDTIDTGVSHVF
jgi:hypothetical protein